MDVMVLKSSDNRSKLSPYRKVISVTVHCRNYGIVTIFLIPVDSNENNHQHSLVHLVDTRYRTIVIYMDLLAQHYSVKFNVF